MLFTTPPTLTQAYPTDNAINIATDSYIKVDFDQPIYAGSGSIVLSNGQGDTRRIAIHDQSQVSVYGYAGFSGSGKYIPPTGFVRITPRERLLSNSTYFIQLAPGVIIDSLGQSLPAINDTTSYNFTTSADTAPPIAISTTPNHQASNVATTSSISVRFNEPVKAGFLNGGFAFNLITLDNGKGDKRSPSIDFDNNTLTLNLIEPLHPNSHYVVQAEADAIKDLAGNALPRGSFSFKTGNDDRTAPELEPISNPDYNPDPITAGHPITLAFNEAMTAGSGTLTFSNAQGDSRKIAARDSQQVKFYASWDSNNSTPQTFGPYVVITPKQALAPHSEYTLKLDAGGLTDMAGNAPTQTSFAIRTGATDKTPPVPVGAPLDRENRPVNFSLNAYFNEPVKAGSGKITLSNGRGDTHAIDISDQQQIYFDGQTLRLQTVQKLLPGNNYYLLVDQGAITDLAGNKFAGVQDKTAFTFSTESLWAADKQPVLEINGGKQQGRYEAGDTLVFNFNRAIKSYESFKLSQHSFGGNDIVISADGLSARVLLDAASTVVPGDKLTLYGVGDREEHFADIEFTL